MVLSKIENKLADFAKTHKFTEIEGILRTDDYSLDNKIQDIREKISPRIMEDYESTTYSLQLSTILTASFAAIFLSAALISFLPEALMVVSASGLMISGAFSCYYTAKRYGKNKQDYDKAYILNKLFDENSKSIKK